MVKREFKRFEKRGGHRGNCVKNSKKRNCGQNKIPDGGKKSEGPRWTLTHWKDKRKRRIEKVTRRGTNHLSDQGFIGAAARKKKATPTKSSSKLMQRKKVEPHRKKKSEKANQSATKARSGRGSHGKKIRRGRIQDRGARGRTKKHLGKSRWENNSHRAEKGKDEKKQEVS